MKPITHTVEIGAPPEAVFEYATDPNHFPEWQNDVVDVRTADSPNGSGVGSRFSTSRRTAGGVRKMTQEVITDNAPFAWSAHGVDGQVRPNADIRIEPLNGGTRSRVTFTLAFEGHGLGIALLPLARRHAENAAAASCDRLRLRMEYGHGSRMHRLPG